MLKAWVATLVLSSSEISTSLLQSNVKSNYELQGQEIPICTLGYLQLKVSTSIKEVNVDICTLCLAARDLC